MPAAYSRLVDAETRDYALAGGGVQSDSGFTSKVVLALGTKKGSCLFFPEFGSRLHEVETADERGRKTAEKYAWQAVQHLETVVDELTVTAELTDAPGAILIRVAGRRGSTSETALYTASTGGG